MPCLRYSEEGKSGGYRVIVFFKSGTRTFFVYGFAKSDQDNITQEQLRKFKGAAKNVFSLTDKYLDTLVASGKYKEV
ncbi:MAG: type II toxin-antitoxin system RelE/ParE family toxin [Treponema sp.]|nr:type II toxin-antitoxin system RelE/ParE family toxin [Treponema sp.]